jgi:predicted RNA binding protein YcfA (HicA-like mRNA interferase family)
MTARELVARIESIGWIKDRQSGSHAVFKHPLKEGRLIVPLHTGDIPKGTLNDIMKKAGLNR